MAKCVPCLKTLGQLCTCMCMFAALKRQPQPQPHSPKEEMTTGLIPVTTLTLTDVGKSVIQPAVAKVMDIYISHINRESKTSLNLPVGQKIPDPGSGRTTRQSESKRRRRCSASVSIFSMAVPLAPVTPLLIHLPLKLQTAPPPLESLWIWRLMWQQLQQLATSEKLIIFPLLPSPAPGLNIREQNVSSIKHGARRG